MDDRYDTFVSQPVFVGDNSQYRERNNASWDRIRHENSSSVRSEPTNYYFYDSEAFNLDNQDNFNQNESTNQNEERVALQEDYSTNTRSEIDIQDDQSLVREPDFEDLETDEKIPEIYCMECDLQIDELTKSEHDWKKCEFIKSKKFSCSSCSMTFNYERNCKIHKISEHFDQKDFSSVTKCIFCPEARNKTFSRFSAYIGHIKSHFTSDSLICKFCKAEFDDSRNLKKHYRHDHSDPNELSYCPKCQIIVPLEESSSHSLLHVVHNNLAASKTKTKKSRSRLAKHNCEECGKHFVRPAELKRHLEVHTRKKESSLPKWKCAICEKTYSHVTGLYEHKRVAHGDSKRLICSFCGITFTKKSNLERHLKNIHPIEPDQIIGNKTKYECPHCPSRHNTAAALGCHMKKVHSIEKSSFKNRIPLDIFTCKICKREFKELIMLKKHKRFHLMVEKKLRSQRKEIYNCEYCEKSYILKASLNWHMQSHLGEESNVVCAICNLEFYDSQEFKKHIEDHHSNSCTLCGQTYSTRREFERHVCNQTICKENQGDIQFGNVHSTLKNVIICRLCKPPQRLITIRQINEHKSKHQSKKIHLCWICHKSFRTSQLLSLHRTVHNSDPIRCSQCSVVFNNRVELKQHIRSIHTNDDSYQCVVHVDRNAAMSAQSFGEYGIVDEQNSRTARAHSVVDWVEQQQNHIHVQNPPCQTREGRIRCEVCKHMYNNIELLCDHWNENETERDHSFSIVTCPICDRRIRGAAEAANHLRNEHFIMVPKSLTFMDMNNTSQSVEQNTSLVIKEPKKGKVHECIECSKVFKKKNDLTRHIRIHTGEKPHECPECGLRFRVKSTLNNHRIIHTNEPPSHECGVCGKMFFERKSLVIHMRIHTGETPVKCKYCDKCFRASSFVKTHEKKCQKMDYSLENKTTNKLVPRNDILYSYAEVGDVNRTIEQISTLPQNELKLSRMSAFDAVHASTSYNIEREQLVVHVIAKPISSKEYVIIVQCDPPDPVTFRDTIDTSSAIHIDQLRSSQSLSVVLHNNMRLNFNTSKMLHISQTLNGVLKKKVPVGPRQAVNDLFEVIAYEEESFSRRCAICEVEFMTKEQSESHFMSEDHEIAQLLFPMTNQQAHIMTNPENVNFIPSGQDNTCKLCLRKFMDLDLLIAHIQKEHERDGNVMIPPRPAAHTAPIH